VVTLRLCLPTFSELLVSNEVSRQSMQTDGFFA